MATQSARVTDMNGYLLVRGCPLSREGIYEYSAKQVGLDGDPNRIVKVYRPRSTVSDPESIDSFKSIPLIDEHTMLSGVGGNHPEYVAPEQKGIDGVLTENVWFDESDGWMKGDIKAFSRKMQHNFRNGKEDLSLGFGCSFLLSPGTWNGQPYEVVQVKMRGNHCANVEEGRIEGARVLDAMCFDSINLGLTVQTDEELSMNALEQLKALVPALKAILEGGAAAQPAAAQPAEPAAEPAAAEPAGVPSEPAAAQPAPEPKPEPEQKPEPTGEPSAPAKDADPSNVTQTSQSQPEPAAAAAAAEPSAPAAEPAAAAPAAEPAAASVPSADSDVAAVIKEVEDLICMVKESLIPQAQNPVGDELNPSIKAGEDMPGQDAALRRFYSDQAKRDQLYGRVSRVIGAFDHAAMDSKSLAEYSIGKLGLKCEKGQEITSLDLYLDGMAKGQGDVVAQQQTTAAVGDSAMKSPEIDAYIAKGGE